MALYFLIHINLLFWSLLKLVRKLFWLLIMSRPHNTISEFILLHNTAGDMETPIVLRSAIGFICYFPPSGKGALEQASRKKVNRVQAIENKCFDGCNLTYLYGQGHMHLVGLSWAKIYLQSYVTNLVRA